MGKDLYLIQNWKIKMIINLDDSGLPYGFFSTADILAYRVLAKNVPNNGIMAEIGTHKGRSLCSLAPILKPRNIKIIAIDSWPIESGGDTWGKENETVVREIFLNHLKIFEIDDIVTLHEDSSIIASTKYPDNYFDFVFLDGAHDYDNVFNDIKAWTPKVKKGGWIGGHDYGNPHWAGVKDAVHNFFGDGNYSIGFFQSYVWGKEIR